MPVANKECVRGDGGVSCGPCPQFRHVVVVGNGPSAITLSFMLSGHWPQYNGNPVADPCLQLRLDDTKDFSLMELNLEELSEGLSGRSRNPVSVLYDALTHPDADLGMTNPSAVDWALRDDRAVSHVVLGKGKPGGAWHAMDGSILTLSFGTWMELPDSDFMTFCDGAKRPTVSTVARYYKNFVAEKQLSPHFLDRTVVTCVRRLFLNCNSPCRKILLEASGMTSSRRRSLSARREVASVAASPLCMAQQAPGVINSCRRRRSVSVSASTLDNDSPYVWEVRGYRELDVEDDGDGDDGARVPFTFVTPNVVLATGTTDSKNRLNVPGEDLDFVMHSLARVEDWLANKRTWDDLPLVVIGAGLTAADAIVAAMSAGVDVYHVFRRDPLDPRVIFNNLPASLYPEYHRVHALMTKRLVEPGYRGFSKCKVIGIRPSGHVLVECENGCGKIKAGAVAALIGSKPNLEFMGRLKNNLGVVPGLALDSKVNVFDGDPFSHESNSFPGLYALGPLVGDNFVRFLQGGALAVAAAVHRKKQHQQLQQRPSSSSSSGGTTY